jgi:hypothetical protein
MASNSSGSMGAVHYWLMFFGLTTLVLGFTTYMGFKDQAELRTQAQQALKSQNDADTNFRQSVEEIGELKRTIGHQMDKVGVGTPNDPNTVVGAMTDDMKKYGKEFAANTYKDTLIALRQQIDDLIGQRNQLQAEVQNSAKQIAALSTQYNNQVVEQKKFATESKADLQTRIRESEDLINRKNEEIAENRAKLNEAILANAKLQEEFDRSRTRAEQNQKKYLAINTQLNEELDQHRQVSFDKADGQIRSIDHSARIVTVNLGSDDNLARGTTFSIYDKRNTGVARGSADIKGKVEVTRILDGHLAEARITEEKLSRPIAPGDIVFSPLWEPGRKLKFSFVGLIDIDSDGKSDRKLLHDMLLAAGAEVDNEVDDEGNRTGNGITVNTKYLVMGEIPDPTNFPPGSADAKRVEKILEQRSALRTEANTQGVRVINLTDFLNYIGYEPKRRIYDPNDTSSPYPIRDGGRRVGINQGAADRFNSSKASDTYKADDNK